MCLMVKLANEENSNIKREYSSQFNSLFGLFRVSKIKPWVTLQKPLFYCGYTNKALIILIFVKMLKSSNN